MAVQRYNRTDTQTLGPNDVRPIGTEVYQSMLPVKIVPQDDDMIITTTATDRLDNLAVKFYGTAALWFVIASVNDLENGEMHVRPGTQLRIPNPLRIIG